MPIFPVIARKTEFLQVEKILSRAVLLEKSVASIFLRSGCGMIEGVISTFWKFELRSEVDTALTFLKSE